MKRRHFIKGVGLSSAALATSAAYGKISEVEGHRLPDYSYGEISSLEDVISREGLTVLRVARKNESNAENISLADRIKVKRASLVRSRLHPFGSREEVMVLWLKGAGESSTIHITGKSGFHFSLGELLQRGEISGTIQASSVECNFLLDREMGKISLTDVGAEEPGSKFSFVAMADPQGGLPDDADGLKTRMKIHNAFIQESVELANRLDFPPLFTMVAGDVCDDWGYEKDLLQMNAFLSKINSPVLYGIGNHETLLRSKFGPGYNMDAFRNFLSAQKAMNGLDKLLYSFNAGQWHFIIWPDPLRTNFWETHPHYFDWLERDLEQHREKPTMVFQHVPIQPIGITPHINYAESVYVRRTYLDILARHGNVKYCLSGHVHIPVKASFKTALSMKGIRLINLPAAGYRPRSFGEADFYGGPTQGIALIHIDGDEASIQYKTVTEEIYQYPTELPGFDENEYPLWLKEKWELPAEAYFKNPDFQDGLKGWAKRFIYMEDVHPSNLRESRAAPEREGRALYLFCKRRGYQAPGQDRLPQDVNRISQALNIEKGALPGISFSFRIDGENTDPDGFAGGYILAEGYSGKRRLNKIMYSAGKIWINNWGGRNQDREIPFLHYSLDTVEDKWQDCTLNIPADYEKLNPGRSYESLNIDRLVLTLGVWNINDGEEQPFGIYFTGFRLHMKQLEPSSLEGAAIAEKDPEDIWWRNKLWPNKNLAGEHRYIIATDQP